MFRAIAATRLQGSRFLSTKVDANKLEGIKAFLTTVSADHSGRGWSSAELRRKSFDDLHRLWIVLYKERNALLTSLARIKRKNEKPTQLLINENIHKVKKSMAGIKSVLAERRKAFKMARKEVSTRQAA